MSGNELIDPELEQQRRQHEREYLDFLDDSLEHRVYTERVSDMIKDGGTRLIVNLDNVREKMAQRADGLLNNFVEEIVCFQNALKTFITQLDVEYSKQHEEFTVGFEGSFGGRHVSPRTLKSRLLGNMVCCEGIVTKCSLVRPKVVRSVHYCEATGKTVERKYADLTSYDTSAAPQGSAYPKEDENKNPLETEYGLCVFRDHQTLSVQELPEFAPAGQLPRSVDVVADADLSDTCQPGDRVRIVGLYRCLPSKQNGYTSGTFKTVLIANNVQIVSKDSWSEQRLSAADVRNIRSLSRNRHAFDILARSLAPSIHGHDEVKKAILCLLVGGSEKTLANGTRLRGDINVMLIGDPSVAKSQLLRYVLHCAPRAVATTGRGSSGVGLTAAVTTDQETGERRLEAGAMVLADRGVVCIDEFDKMSDMDRTAIHEVMEQGRVTVAKAGIHAQLNARCSVLSAANPVYGRYDLYKTPMENIGMQDSLLSRFDLLFVLLDEHDATRDNHIAGHIVNLHRYRAPAESDGAPLPLGSALDDCALSTLDLNADAHGHEGGKAAGAAAHVYEKHKSWMAPSTGRIVTVSFLRKYLALAKNLKPRLTDAASEYITEKYAELRERANQKMDEAHADAAGRFDDNKERTMPVTARQLETLIRISTAHAKTRMSKTVDRIDAEIAAELLYYACFKEKSKERLVYDEQQKTKQKRRASKAHGGGDDEAESDDEHDDDGGDEAAAATRDAEATENVPPDAKRARLAPTDGGRAPAISVDRYKIFKRHIRPTFESLSKGDLDEMVEQGDMTQAIQKLMGSEANRFTDDELAAAWDKLQADNAVMLDDGKVALI